MIEDQMAYDARAIANCFIDLAKEKGRQLTPMKMQKLIFFAHGWNLALKDEPLIVDPIQAWQYGPVVPSVYHAFKKFGSGVITSHASDFDLETLDFKVPKVPSEDKSVRSLLNTILDVFGQLTAVQLSNLSHVKGGPWDIARTGKGENEKDVVIDDKLIKKYFVEKADQKTGAAA